MAVSVPIPAGGAATPVRPRAPRQRALEQGARSLGRGIEGAVVVIGLLLFTRAFSSMLPGAATDPNGENEVLRTVYTSVYIVSFPAVCLHWRAVLAAAARNGWLLGLVALALLSTAWSVAPDISLRRGVAWALTTLFGIYLAARYDTRTLLQLTAAALGISAVLSAAVSVGLPAHGVESEIHVGAWRGVFPQKNNLAQMMVLSVLVFLLLHQTLQRGRWIATLGTGLSLALVLLSTSKTAVAVLALLSVLAVLYRSLRWRYTVAIPFLITCALVGGSVVLWLMGNAERLLVGMGRDPTLTGRTPMWTVIMEMVSRRPWLGYGYSAFWLPGPGSPAAEVHQVLQWETPGAHNGFLDLALQLGWVGVALFGLGFAVASARAVGLLMKGSGAETFWPIMYLSYFFLYNITESGLAVRHSILWVLYVSTVCSLGARRSTAAAEAEPPWHRGAAPQRAVRPVLGVGAHARQ